MFTPLLAAVWLAPSAVQAQREPVTFAPTRAVLVLIPGADAAQALAAPRAGTIDPASQAESDLVRDCANGERQRPQTSKGLLWSVTAHAWRVLLHPLAVSVHDELAKYARVSEATASGDYYRASDSSGGAALNSRISCLRFTRFGAADAAGDDVALDFVASVRLDSARDAILLCPLRLFVSQAAAKSANGRYGVAISMRADAVWRDEFAGHRGRVFEETIARESVDLKSGPYLKYYPTDVSNGVRVPIVPMSFGADRSRDFGRAEFGVSVAELGTPPATLALLSQMLPDPNEGLGQLVIAAALAGAGTR